MAKDATPWTILSWGSILLHGSVQRPCPQPLGVGTSLGVLRPFSARGEESPRPPFGGTLVAQGCRQIPLRRLRCRSQVLSTSQRRSSSPRPPTIFRQVALLGFCPTGACSSHEAPTTRRRRRTFLAFLPRVDRAPILGGSARGRAGRFLGICGAASLWPSRFSSSW